MKPGRNEPCPCGSDKKYKRCCMDSVSKQHASMLDDIEQIAAMNPNLSLDDLNVVAEQKAQVANNKPNSDLCGLSPIQIYNWLYAPLNELQWVKISTPTDVSSSSVMRYLELILDEAMHNDGSFKATSKGNLPTKLVRQASAIFPELAVSQYPIHISISEYAGSNEDKFNALHYSRILAEIAGIIYRRSGRYHVKKAAQKQYQAHGIQAFFIPMLEAATSKYNWGYLDSFQHDIDLRTFWVFMLWRIQNHGCVDQLIEEMVKAFPDLLEESSSQENFTPSELLGILIESRFIKRFLEFWGFVTVNPKRYVNEQYVPREAAIQPLMEQVFQFRIMESNDEKQK
jgi:hypothetical protein